MNKILVLAPVKVPASLRLKEQALVDKVGLDILSISDLTFVSGAKTGVFYNGTDLVKKYSLLVVRDFHPHVSEAITVARLFADAGKRVVDASLVDEGYSISKMHDYLRLAQAGLGVPKTWQAYKISDYAGKLKFPCILKGDHGSLGEHVYKISDSSELAAKFSEYAPGQLLLQEFLPAEGDYRVFTIGYKALPKMVFRRPPQGEFRTNYQFATNWESLDLIPELKKLAEKASKVLSREFSAVDIRYRGKTPLILEVNRRPGFEGFEESTGLNVAHQFLNYLKK